MERHLPKGGCGGGASHRPGMIFLRELVEWAHNNTHLWQIQPGKIVLSSLPAPLTQFIGRQRERQEAARLLADPACRLLTLVGPGGMGKTRLAIALAHQLEVSFADGVPFVPLQAVTSADWLIAAVAEALDVSLAGCWCSPTSACRAMTTFLSLAIWLIP